MSSELFVDHGVPQGSVLGLLLFLLLVNNFSNLDEVLLYADHTTLIIGDATVGEIKKEAVVEHWLRNNRLSAEN